MDFETYKETGLLAHAMDFKFFMNRRPENLSKEQLSMIYKIFFVIQQTNMYAVMHVFLVP